MENNTIVINLNDFKGKSILSLKQEIQNQLKKIQISYLSPNPTNENRKIILNPYKDFDFSSNDNYETIEEIMLTEN